MASLKKDVFKPIVFPGLGGDKSASKTNAFFTLQFISGYLIRKCLRAIPTIFVQFLTMRLTKKYYNRLQHFFGKEVSYFSMTPQSLWLELEGAEFGKARFHDRLEPCLQAETWV